MTLKDENEEEKHRQDVMKKDKEEQEERVRVAPNMGARGSHFQATSDREEEKGEERPTAKWADCIDEQHSDGKEGRS